MHVNLL